MAENDKNDAFIPRDPHDSRLSANEEIINKLDASGVSLTTPEGAQREDSLTMPWLPTTMGVDTSHDSSQTFVLDESHDSGHGIYVQIPYPMVSDESNQGHLHGSIISQPEDIVGDDDEDHNGEMKLMVKFGDTVCPLSMFGLDASSFVGKISQAGEGDESDQMYHHHHHHHHHPTSNLTVSDGSIVEDVEKATSGYCSLCGKFIKDSVEMEKHLIYHQDNTNAMSIPSGSGVACIDLSVAHKSCPACGNQLRHHESFSQRDFVNEFRTIEQLTNIPMFTCDECGKDYALGISQDMGTCDPSDNMTSQSVTSAETSYTVPSNSNYDYNSSDMSYPRESSISNHSGANPSTSRFSCSECGKSYKHNRDLRKHVRTRHAGSEADMYLNTKPMRNYNNQQNNSFAPPKMDETSLSEHFMHMDATLGTSHSSVLPSATPSIAKIMCDLCRKYFRGTYELRRHIKTVHENNRPFKCQSCDKSFRDAHELLRHNAGHQRPSFPYSPHHSMRSGSSQDSSAYSDSKDLYIKRMSFIGENTSSGSFSRSQHVYSHSNDSNIDQNNSNDLYQQGSSAISDGSIYNSDRSSMIVQTLPSMEHHTISNSTTSATIAKSHSMNIGSIANDYFCSVCEKNFRGANEFKRHYSVVHEKKYRYKCIHCGKLWRDQYDLKRHCKRSHFLDQEIDKSFIKQCLLANGSLASIQSVSSQHSNLLPCMTAPGMDLINSNVTDSYTHATSVQPIIVDSRRHQPHLESVILHERVDSINHPDNNGMTLVNRNDVESYISSGSSTLSHRTHVDIPESSHCSPASMNNVRNEGNILFTCDFSPHQVITKSASSSINLNNSNQSNVPHSTVSPVHPSWNDLITGT